MTNGYGFAASQDAPSAVWAYMDASRRGTGDVPIPGYPVDDALLSPSSEFRSASVLKPIFAWAAKSSPCYQHDTLAWAKDSAGSVLVSDNLSATTVWANAGGTGAVCELVRELTGVTIYTDGSERDDPYAFPFGRVLITAEKTAQMYHSLAHAALRGDTVARTVIGWMAQTLPSQRFRAAPFGNRDPVKCGWSTSRDELLLRTHAVRIVHYTSANPKVGVVLTALPFPEDTPKDKYVRLYQSGRDVTEINDKVAGTIISTGMVKAFTA